MRPGATPNERFEAWFVRPMEKLKELPEGDGAFAVLMIALPLYERYIVAKLKLAGKSTAEKEKRRAIGEDLGLSSRDRSIFWEMFRNGFMHHAMTKAGATGWLVSHEFSALPEFRTYKEQSCVCIDPWKFAERVIAAFRDDPRLITASESFPMADVFPVSPDSLSPPRTP